MVQVDVFWAYGLGAGFAAAAGRQIARAGRTSAGILGGPHALNAILFHALVFAPSGVCLLWSFPSWETMHVGDRDLPGWLVTAFAVTNVTQGMLGFLVAGWLARRGRLYAAFLQMLLGHFMLFFILIHGWDGTGWQRFFSPTREAFLRFTPGDIPQWFASDVALTLYAFGVVLLPWFFGVTSRWIGAGYELDGAASPRRPGALTRVALLARSLLGVCLLSALGASLLLRAVGPAVGIPAAMALLWLGVVRRGAVAHRIFTRLYAVAP